MKKAALVVCVLLCLGLVSVFAATPALKTIVYNPNSPTGGLTVPWLTQPLTVTWLKPGNWKNDGVLAGIIKEKLKIIPQITAFPEDQYGQKLQLMIVSDSLPDLVFFENFDVNNIDKLGASGRLVAMDKYFPIMPNTRKLLADWPALMPWLSAPDGHIYHTGRWGSYAPLGIATSAHLIRNDVFQKYGITQKWDTYDNFYATLKALKAKTPDYYPWGTRSFSGMFNAMAWGFGTGWERWASGWGGMYYDDRSDTYKFAPYDPGYKAMVAFLAKAYAEGILHPEVPTMNSDLFFKYWTNTADGAVYTGLAVNSGDTVTWESDWQHGKMKGHEGQDVLFLKPPVANVAGARAVYQNGQIDAWSLGVGFAVNSKAKNPQALMTLLDYMVSKEGMFFFDWGKEGVTFRWFNSPTFGKIPVPFKSPVENYGSDSGQFYDAVVRDLQWDAGFSDWGINIKSSPERAGIPYSGALKLEVQTRAKQYMIAPAPRVMMDDISQELYTSTQADLSKMIQENVTSFVIGKKPMADWDKFIADAKQNADLCLQIMNKAWASTKKIVAGLGK